jgi:tRNA (guanine10-N2)-dimethyltransferase
MRLIFELSGEHNTLPRSEILASIEAEGHDWRMVDEADRILILDTDADSVRLGERIALAHNVGELLASGTESDLEDAAKDLVDIEGTIAIRMRDLRPKPKRTENRKLLESIGGILTKERKVNLDDPENEIRLIHGDKYYMTLNRASIDRPSFQRRKVDNRPFFSPISLHPKFARAMVNLARASTGRSFLDPFCGTGGILIEAGMIGAKVIGGDAKKEMIEGCNENLRKYGISSDLLRSDVGDLRGKVEKVHSIATDPPYGRSSSTIREEPGSLYERSFKTIADAIVLPKEEFVEIGSQFLELQETHKQRVHKSLDRFYCVFRNH